MGVRHFWLALALALAACGQAGQTLPSAPSFGPSAQDRSSLLASHKWYVDGVHGSNNNDCKSRAHACKTIGHAISLSASGDSVIVAAATYPENLTINHSLELVGARAATTIIDGRGVASAIITPNPKAVITVAKVTLRNGGGVGDGGAVYNCMSVLTIADSIITGNTVQTGMHTLAYGGAIYNCPFATLTIVNTTLSKNTAEAGGAICNGGLLTIENSTFTENKARSHRGGGIFNYGTLVISNSTFSGNAAPGAGGAIHNGTLLGGKGILFVSNSTISGNSAQPTYGGGIYNLNGAAATIQNSIVSNNAGGNCRGTITSKGHNLSGDDSCTFSSTGDLNNTDPKLGPLQNNGGPTQTMALEPQSPSIDAGNPNGCTDGRGHALTTDQRGEPRPDAEDSRGCDIGAYERQED